MGIFYYTDYWYDVLAAMSIREVDGLAIYDLGLSLIGVAMWLVVSILWNDRALIILNGAGLLFLLSNLIQSIIN